MTLCKPACVCRCDQQACACYATPRTTALPASPAARFGQPASRCSMPNCGRPTLIQVVRTKGNRDVYVTWCPACDGRSPGR